MAKLRKFVAYRRLERPYTRTSKYKKEAYIRTSPAVKIVRFVTGNSNRKFKYTLLLLSKSDLQIRDNALESARQTSNRLMELSVGLQNYHMHIKAYPFHVLREHALASGAGADRFSSGMARSFGKPTGKAARIKKGDTIIQLSVNKEHLDTAKKALHRALTKIPCACTIQLTENKSL